MMDEFLIGINSRFDRVESELRAIGDRIDGLQRLMVRGTFIVCAEIIPGNAVLAALLLTRH